MIIFSTNLQLHRFYPNCRQCTIFVIVSQMQKLYYLFIFKSTIVDVQLLINKLCNVLDLSFKSACNEIPHIMLVPIGIELRDNWCTALATIRQLFYLSLNSDDRKCGLSLYQRDSYTLHPSIQFPHWMSKDQSINKIYYVHCGIKEQKKIIIR